MPKYPERWLTITSLLLLTCGLICSVLCLLAGSRPELLEDFDIFTLDLSGVKPPLVDKKSFTPGDIRLDDQDSSIAAVPTEIQSAADKAISSASEFLSLPDFYSIHVSSVCKGDYEADAGQQSSTKKVNSCSGYSSDSKLDLQSLIEEDTGALIGSKWPSVDPLPDYSMVFRVIKIFYIMLICITSAAILFSLARLFTDSRQVLSCSMASGITATVFATVISITSTVVVRKAVAGIEDYGSSVGVSARGGSQFLRLSWGSAGILLAANIFGFLSSRDDLEGVRNLFSCWCSRRYTQV